MIKCMETKVESAPEQEAASRILKVESASTPDAELRGELNEEKSWSKAPLLAFIAAVVVIAGLAWLYYDAVSAVQTALSVYKL
jgi:hypothetical protein